MPRRDARQTSLVDLLDASLAKPSVRPGVDAEWSARLIALLAEGLPPGAPSPVREVARVWPAKTLFDGHLSMFAEVVMFDGAAHDLRILASGTHREYEFWLAPGTQPAGSERFDLYFPSIRWDARAHRWVRGEPSTSNGGAGWEVDLAGPVAA